ncbi:MAG: type II secretion system F family protein [Alicyclobacillus macrosporangiidus]|uniref:type II secretion system F family protein n=1 Tax=Alicyclobacillus macrosporangiidus TaxID=392015 RepID=UPI0026EC9EDD|nr:type II secretion system F family protein [Alicyclobacillus macrosporangiidus]MCL6598566.1 type II secretion system F family protein [Alicyclobacillus macrosporangiidus]
MEFRYKAVDARGKRRRGRVAAEDRREALRKLRESGLYATELAATAEKAVRAGEDAPRWRVSAPAGLRARLEGWPRALTTGRLRTGGSVTAKDLAVFSRQLATLVRAGVGVASAVEVLAAETENRRLAAVLLEVVGEMHTGHQLSAALAARPRAFPPLLTNLVRAGEASGSLDEVLERAAVHFEKQHYTREKVKSALAYPVLVSLVAVLVTVFLLVKVVPTFVEMFRNYNAPLPLPTRVVMGVSSVFVHAWFLVLAATVLLYTGYRVALRHERFRLARDRLRLRVPVFGQLALKSAMATMARTMGTLFASGVPVLQCLDLTASAVDNAVVAQGLLHAREGIAMGQPMSQRLAGEPVFPPLVTHMIRVGEETGNLDLMLGKVADFYEAETEALADRLKALLEPMLVLVLAVIVGTIVLSVIAPMFAIYQQIGSLG